MFVKVKAILFGCCVREENPDQSEVDKKTKGAGTSLVSHMTPINIHYKSEIDTTDIPNTFATTTDRLQEDSLMKGVHLKLVVIESDIIPVNKEFLIADDGLKFGGRRKLDGCVYIGRQKLAKNTHIVINDIVLEDPGVGEKHCMIRYNHKLKKYFIKDQGQGSGTFVKVVGSVQLKSGYIISFSDSHMIVKIARPGSKDECQLDFNSYPVEKSEEEEKDTLTVKFLNGPKAQQVFKFSPKEGTIRVGRVSDCQIKFDENNLSRYQCAFQYLNDMWYLHDGIEDKPSTNGTWIFPENFYEIAHGTIIKIGQTLLQANLGADVDKELTTTIGNELRTKS